MKKKYRQKHIILIVSILFLTITKVSRRDVSKYYKNMIFVGFFNTMYYRICKRHLLWEFTPIGINKMVLRFIHMLLVTPLMVVSFLSEIPKTLLKKWIYFAQWILLSTFVEYVVHKNKLIYYAHGWNLLWSGLMYAKMYVYSFLFTKQPVKTLLLSLCSTLYFMKKFHVPLKKKHYSKYIHPKAVFYFHSFVKELEDSFRKAPWN